MPPNGRQENGELREAWIANCSMALAERTAWVPVPVLVEIALLAAMERPMRWQVKRADVIMHERWAEPSAAALGLVQVVAYEPWHADAITPALCAMYGEKPGQPGSIVNTLRRNVGQSSLVRTLLDGGVPVAVMGCVVGREAGAPWLFRTERAFGRPLALARA